MKTNGKRTWTKDEFEKTLELFFELVQAKKGFSKDDVNIIQVADELNRSVNSVIMRLQNYVYCFRELCPDKADEYGIGNGLSNGGKECMYLLESFLKTRGEDMVKEKKDKSHSFNSSTINRIVLKLAVKFNDEEFDSDGSVSNSLQVLFKYISNETFSWSQLEEIHTAVSGILFSAKDYGHKITDILIEIIGSMVDEETLMSLKKLLCLFVIVD